MSLQFQCVLIHDTNAFSSVPDETIDDNLGRSLEQPMRRVDWGNVMNGVGAAAHGISEGINHYKNLNDAASHDPTANTPTA